MLTSMVKKPPCVYVVYLYHNALYFFHKLSTQETNILYFSSLLAHVHNITLHEIVLVMCLNICSVF